MPVARWVLPVPGGPRKTTLSLAATKSRVPRWAIGLPVQAAGVVEVELFEGLAGREPGGADAAFAAVGLSGGDLALQARGQELLVGPGRLPGAFGQAWDRLPKARRFQGAGQERQLGLHVTGGAVLGGHQATCPSVIPNAVSYTPRSRCSTTSGCGAGVGLRARAASAKAAAWWAGSVIDWCRAQHRSCSASTFPARVTVTVSRPATTCT